jgi:hypothetical protein
MFQIAIFQKFPVASFKQPSPTQRIALLTAMAISFEGNSKPTQIAGSRDDSNLIITPFGTVLYTEKELHDTG